MQCFDHKRQFPTNRSAADAPRLRRALRTPSTTSRCTADACVTRDQPEVRRSDVALPALDVLEQHAAVGEARAPRELVELVARPRAGGGSADRGRRAAGARSCAGTGSPARAARASPGGGDPGAAAAASAGDGAGGAQLRVGVAVDELEVLRGELDVHHAAGAELEIAGDRSRPPPSSRSIRSRIWRIALGDRARAAGGSGGWPYTVSAASRATCSPSSRSPATGRSLISAWRSHSRASLGVVPAPAGERGDQQALRSRRPQPGVDLVEPAARGALAQRAEQALGAAREPLDGGERRRAVGLAVVAGVDEHDVEIGGVAELAAAELAEAEHGEPGVAGRPAVARGELAPRRSRARGRGRPRRSRSARRTPRADRARRRSRRARPAGRGRS